jgi:hypothetical protein
MTHLGIPGLRMRQVTLAECREGEKGAVELYAVRMSSRRLLFVSLQIAAARAFGRRAGFVCAARLKAV